MKNTGAQLRRENAKRPPFKIGDRVRSMYEMENGTDRVYIVSWICKGTFENRKEQVIAVESNGRQHGDTTWANIYTEAK